MFGRYVTSESVTEGHPDKVADQISDAILDEILRQDPYARVACETCCKTGFVMVFGEVTTSAVVNYENIVREVIRDIGYTSSDIGFDADSCGVIVSLSKQSSDIALGVDESIEVRDLDSKNNKYDKIGAGDQGMMFGYANSETKEYMPFAISMAHKLTRRLTEVRKNKIVGYLRPDGKSQVTVEYDEKTGSIKRIDCVVVSTQHNPDVDIQQLRADVKKHVIDFVLPSELIDEDTKILINPTGRFVIGGPMGDSGLTGRKIIVDTYGTYASHGGGAFSGKDPTKVDRSANYMARYAAKNVVAAGLAKECQLSVAYAIGVAHPTDLGIKTNGTGIVPDDIISQAVKKVFDFRPAAIIDELKLREPIYRKTTNYGHFGRNIFRWERVDKVQQLKDEVAKLMKN